MSWYLNVNGIRYRVIGKPFPGYWKRVWIRLTNIRHTVTFERGLRIV